MIPDRRLCSWFVVFAAMVVALSPVPARAASDISDIAVNVVKDGSVIHVEVDCPVNAPRAVVWDVLTDYDHMTQFISNLEKSIVRMRLGDRLQVFQKGKATRGPLSFAFENVREVELVPQTEIRSRMITGDAMPAEFTTRIEERNGKVHILHTGKYTPNVWVPPVVGPSLIQQETRRQYGEIREEMLRRVAGPK